MRRAVAEGGLRMVWGLMTREKEARGRVAEGKDFRGWVSQGKVLKH